MEKEKLTYGEMCEKLGFRLMNHGYSAVRLTDKLRPSIKGFPNEETANGALLYCYIDHEAGITFEIMAAGNVEKNGKGFDFENILECADNEIRSIIRLEAIADEEYIGLNVNEDLCNELFAKKLEVIEMYEPSEDIAKTREMDYLDGSRDPICIDDILVLFAKDGLENETIWVRLEGVGDCAILGTLLNEPYQDFGCHMGDTVSINIYQTEDDQIIPFVHYD